jgi:hypothetical protein
MIRKTPPRMGLDRLWSRARVGTVKTEDLLRYEAELRSVKIGFGTVDLVIDWASNKIAPAEVSIPRRLPPDNPQARPVRRCSGGRLP